MSVPKLNVSAGALDRFSHDLEKLTLDAAFKAVPKTDAKIPAFQRQGFMEKLGHTRKKWFKRFFVLRDSFLLSYNLDKSELTVQPRASIHLAHSKIMPVDSGNKICFVIIAADKEEYEFAVQSEEERKGWLKDLQIARMINHSNMVKLAVENSCIAEAKGLTEVTKDKSTSSLTIFSNPEYIRQTPSVGGAEGWLYTPGFNTLSNQPSGIFSSKAKWFKAFFILRDSHLMMFKSGDSVSKPRSCMYLVGTVVEPLETEERYGFVLRSANCGDLVELAAETEALRLRWTNALKIGARVTYRDFKLLLKEHELISSVSVTPRGAPAEATEGAEGEEQVPTAAPSAGPMLHDESDILGNQLDPGAVQPYTAEGNPILRSPEGKLVDSMTGQEISPMDPRFSENGQQLDPFNRPLPPGAQPMFTSEGIPIGVGIDGSHYLPDGTVVEKDQAHFDSTGKQLEKEVIDAADGIAVNVSIAIQVRAQLAVEGTSAEVVDHLGRTFRDMNADAQGMVVNADGDKIPIKTARVLDRDNKEIVDFQTFRNKENKTHRDQGTVPFTERTGKLTILVEDEDSPAKEIGNVEVQGGMSLSDLRHAIESEIVQDDFVFVSDSLPLSAAEEKAKYALAVGETVTIRPRNRIGGMTSKATHAKLEQMRLYELEKQKEAEKFRNIMAAIQSGTFLKHSKKNIEEAEGEGEE
eukprot:c8974_g1_i2.p1 GENE.c8974_g1_i2~~c8974_g1_i2.p1  ORF type:complete len:694 (+),score=169.59 c8974_g1_i2:41-2122(+)